MTRANHLLPGKPGRVTSPEHRWPAARFEAEVISVTSEKAGLVARQAPASLHRPVRDTDRALPERNRSRTLRRPGRGPAPRPRQVGRSFGTVRHSRITADSGLSQAAPGARTISRTVPPVAVDLPVGLARLRNIAHALTSAAVPDGLRIIVTCPTTRFAAVAAAVGALEAGLCCDGCLHEQLGDGMRVSAYLDGRFTDRTLLHAGHAELDFGGQRLVRNRDSVHRLPYAFPERHDHKLDPDLREQLMLYLACQPAAVGFRHSARCAHPVLIVGEPGAVRDDLGVLDALHPGAHLPARLHIGTHLAAWYRHPVLAVGRLPGPGVDGWLDQVRPRLGVFAGSAGWSASWRSRWPNVPQLVLLSRRSPAAAEAAAAITAGWAMPPAGMPHLPGGLLAPGAGLEIGVRCEPCSMHGEEGEEEW